MLGREMITLQTGMLASPEPDAIYNGWKVASVLSRDAVRNAYLSAFGLHSAAKRLISQLEALGLRDWSELVSLQRPAEARFKLAIRGLNQER
jgi:hypothetical protein